jgi:hypothetical protein
MTWAPDIEIDMTVIRHACALVQGVRTGDPELHIAPMVAWARTSPDAVATLAVVLACIANEDAARPEHLFDVLALTGVDISPVLKEAHRTYEDYRKRREARKAPAWALAGEKTYQRLRHVRRRASEQGVA